MYRLIVSLEKEYNIFNIYLKFKSKWWQRKMAAVIKHLKGTMVGRVISNQEMQKTAKVCVTRFREHQWTKKVGYNYNWDT